MQHTKNCILALSTAVTIGFNQTVYMASEEDDYREGSKVDISINLYGELDRNIIVIISTENGSAIGKSSP